MNMSLAYEQKLMEVRMSLLVQRNWFNNILDDELAEIIIRKINILEDEENYFIKKIKQERRLRLKNQDDKMRDKKELMI